MLTRGITSTEQRCCRNSSSNWQFPHFTLDSGGSGVFNPALGRIAIVNDPGVNTKRVGSVADPFRIRGVPKGI